jgi:hypothetical protein
VLLPSVTDVDAPRMMLAARSLVWAAGKVTDESPVADGRRVYRVDPPGKDFDFAVARRAYVVAEPDGRGVAIIIHLPRESAARLDSLWSAILPTVQLEPSDDASVWLRNGKLEVARHRNAPAPPRPRGVWWLHSDSITRARGWVQERTAPNNAQGSSLVRSRGWNGELIEIDTRWKGDATTRTTTRIVRDRLRKPRAQPADAPDASAEDALLEDPDEVLRQTVELSDDVLRTALLGTLVARTEESTPADFVWQQDLPEFLSRATRFPLSIQTDAMPGVDGRVVPGLLRLLVRAENQAAESIVLHVEPIGAGQGQRWTFDRATRTLTEIRLPDGSLLTPSREADVRLRFQGDPMMLP